MTAKSWILPVAAAIVLAALPPLLTPYTQDLVVKIAVFAIFALSLELLVGTTGLVSLGHAAFFGIGAYATVLFTGGVGSLPGWLAPLAGDGSAAPLPKLLVLSTGFAALYALFVGAVLWSVSCARRGWRVEEFARGELSAWSWRGYVWLTLAGLALLGVACLGFAVWVGVLLLVSAAAFTAIFLVSGDIPPFVFYIVLTVVGVWVILVAPQ